MEAAIITAAVTLIVAFITQFFAESYRRHLDGCALAAGLAGELASYEGAVPFLERAFDAYEDAARNRTRSSIPNRPFPRPKDRYYNEVVGRIGVLGSEFTEDIVYVYNQLDAFRSTFGLILEIGQDMSDDEFLARIAAARFAFGEANTRGAELLPRLKIRARERYSFRWHGKVSP